jgi:hypothetical protein
MKTLRTQALTNLQAYLATGRAAKLTAAIDAMNRLQIGKRLLSYLNPEFAPAVLASRARALMPLVEVS